MSTTVDICSLFMTIGVCLLYYFLPSLELIICQELKNLEITESALLTSDRHGWVLLTT